MSTENTYNGWTNYATWRVNLEICNDDLDGIAQDVSAGYRDRFADTTELADYLKDTAEEVLTMDGTSDESLAYSYAMAFLSDVNWYEIASHWTDELVQAEEEEEEEEDTEEVA